MMISSMISIQTNHYRPLLLNIFFLNYASKKEVNLICNIHNLPTEKEVGKGCESTNGNNWADSETR